jgi:hypothetical protein
MDVESIVDLDLAEALEAQHRGDDRPGTWVTDQTRHMGDIPT